MLVDTSTPSYGSSDIGLQKVFQHLLSQGLSYVQIIIRYNLCKKLYKKGTPEFYQCMGVPAPVTKPKPKPKPNKTQKPHPSPSPSTQHAPIKTSSQAPPAKKFPFNPVIPMVLGGAVILLLLLRRRNNKPKEVKG